MITDISNVMTKKENYNDIEELTFVSWKFKIPTISTIYTCVCIYMSVYIYTHIYTHTPNLLWNP